MTDVLKITDDFAWVIVIRSRIDDGHGRSTSQVCRVGMVGAHRSRANFECQAVSKTVSMKPERKLLFGKTRRHVVREPFRLEDVATVRDVNQFVRAQVSQCNEVPHKR